MTLVEKIRSLANQRNMSLPQLEVELGVGNGTISRWKNSAPSTEKLSRVADYFGVSIDYLLGRDIGNYYIDPDVAEIAEEMATRPELKVLFKASRNVSKESIEAINNMIKQMKK